MKNTPQRLDLKKRKLLFLLAGLPMLTACEGEYYRSARLAGEARDKMYYADMNLEERALHERLKKKFHGIYGLVLKIDAISPKHGVTLTNERGRMISADSTVGLKNVSNMTYTDNSMPIPKAVRATWREGNFESVYGGGWKGGTIIGDYSVPVAERIPDSILDYIRKNGGALRLKIRLKDDGVLIGWDVERSLPIPGCKPGEVAVCTALQYFLPGGDFKEAQPATFNGAENFPYSFPLPLSEENKAFLEKHDLFMNGNKVWEKGWYIDKNGQKVETTW